MRDFKTVAWRERPIVNADRWLHSENRRIASGTRNAARLAVKSLRAERKSTKRWTWWM